MWWSIPACSRAIRHLGKHSDDQLDSLSKLQLTDFFSLLLVDGSRTMVKLGL